MAAVEIARLDSGTSYSFGTKTGATRVVWVHVADLPADAPVDPSAMNDGDRGLPGESGAIDNRGLLRYLSAARYDGPVTAEPMPGCRTLSDREPEAIAHRVAAAMRSVWPLDDLRR